MAGTYLTTPLLAISLKKTFSFFGGDYAAAGSASRGGTSSDLKIRRKINKLIIHTPSGFLMSCVI